MRGERGVRREEEGGGGRPGRLSNHGGHFVC